MFELLGAFMFVALVIIVFVAIFEINYDSQDKVWWIILSATIIAMFALLAFMRYA